MTSALSLSPAWRLARSLRVAARAAGDALGLEIAEAFGEHLHMLAGTGLPWRLADAFLPEGRPPRQPACEVPLLVGAEGRGAFEPTADLRAFGSRLEAAAPFLTDFPLRATGGELVLAGEAVLSLLQRPGRPGAPFELYSLGAAEGGAAAGGKLAEHLGAAWGARLQSRRGGARLLFEEKGGGGRVVLHLTPRSDAARLLGELGLGAGGALFTGGAVFLSGPARLALERRLLLFPPEGVGAGGEGPAPGGTAAARLFAAGYDLAFPGAPAGVLPAGLALRGARRLRANAFFAEALCPAGRPGGPGAPEIGGAAAAANGAVPA